MECSCVAVCATAGPASSWVARIWVGANHDSDERDHPQLDAELTLKARVTGHDAVTARSGPYLHRPLPVGFCTATGPQHHRSDPRPSGPVGACSRATHLTAVPTRLEPRCRHHRCPELVSIPRTVRNPHPCGHEFRRTPHDGGSGMSRRGRRRGGAAGLRWRPRTSVPDAADRGRGPPGLGLPGSPLPPWGGKSRRTRRRVGQVAGPDDPVGGVMGARAAGTRCYQTPSSPNHCWTGWSTPAGRSSSAAPATCPSTCSPRCVGGPWGVPGW